MLICNHCGIIRTEGANSCRNCRVKDVDAVTSVESSDHEPMWVEVRAHFACSACGFDVPVNHLETGGSLRCDNCGLNQRFKPDIWKDALTLAHGVADLAGPGRKGLPKHGPSSRRYLARAVRRVAGLNFGDRELYMVEHGHTSGECREAHQGPGCPFSLPRDSSTSPTSPRPQSSDLELVLTPGHPVCEDCHVPLSLSRGDSGQMSLSCPECARIERYSMPEGDLPETLSAVRAPLHRTDVMVAIRSEDAGTELVALSCPSCGGGLPAPEDGSFALCRFCETTVYITASARGGSGKVVPPSPWWLAFRGPSKVREAWLSVPVEPEPSGAADTDGGSEADSDKVKMWLMILVLGGIGLAAILRYILS